MKRLLFNKTAFALAAAGILLVGMVRDPDEAKGDDLNAGPVTHEYMPGYQFSPEQAQPLSRADLAQLNTPAESGYPTF